VTAIGRHLLFLCSSSAPAAGEAAMRSGDTLAGASGAPSIELTGSRELARRPGQTGQPGQPGQPPSRSICRYAGRADTPVRRFAGSPVGPTRRSAGRADSPVGPTYRCAGWPALPACRSRLPALSVCPAARPPVRGRMGMRTHGHVDTRARGHTGTWTHGYAWPAGIPACPAGPAPRYTRLPARRLGMPHAPGLPTCRAHRSAGPARMVGPTRLPTPG
jgi:hypothetical protein